MWGRFLCWWTGKHVPIEIIRDRPRRKVDICGRCGIDLSDDRWSAGGGGDGPKRMA